MINFIWLSFLLLLIILSEWGVSFHGTVAKKLIGSSILTAQISGFVTATANYTNDLINKND